MRYKYIYKPILHYSMSTILTDKYFPDMPKFPDIKATAIGRQQGKTDLTAASFGIVPNPMADPNSIYHNKRVHTTNLRRVDPNTYEEVIGKAWVIPFTVDTLLPLTEVTQRIDAALDKLGLYTNWKINYNDYTITAIEKNKVELK